MSSIIGSYNSESREERESINESFIDNDEIGILNSLCFEKNDTFETSIFKRSQSSNNCEKNNESQHFSEYIESHVPCPLDKTFKNEENKQSFYKIYSSGNSEISQNQNKIIKKKNKNTKQKINQFESWDDSLENDLSKYDFSTNDPNELISKAVEIYNKFKAKVKDFVENDFVQFQDMIDRELEKLKEKLQDLAERFVSQRISDCSLENEKLLLCLKEAKESCQNSKIDKKFQEITKALLPERKRKDNFIVNKIDHKNGSIKRGKRFDTIWKSLIIHPRLLMRCIKKYPTFDEDTFPKYIINFK